MTYCKDIAQYIEKLCPLSLACDWDNVGLLVGDKDKKISKVLICLDNDEKITLEAEALGVDMIISHHPIMFSPINRLTEADPQQRMLRKMCALGICHYTAHTNMDCALGGLNDYLAEKLGFTKTEIVEKTTDNAGFGRMADCNFTLGEMISLCKEKLGLETVSYVGELDRKIKKVVINSGSGSSILPLCIENDVDLLVTGDLKYNVARDAYENNVAIIDAGHYGTEIIFTQLMKEYLEKEFPNIEFIVSKENVPVIKVDK